MKMGATVTTYLGGGDTAGGATSKLPTRKNIKKKNSGDEVPLDIMALNPQRSLNEVESTLEYILISLCQALNILPKQAAALLTNHNHYLLHACVKGVKGNYDPIVQWYQNIYATSKHLTTLAIDSYAQGGSSSNNNTSA